MIGSSARGTEKNDFIGRFISGQVTKGFLQIRRILIFLADDFAGNGTRSRRIEGIEIPHQQMG